jgi:hypothetical protein
MSIGSNVKSRVVNWILAVVNRDLDKAKLEEMQSRADSNHTITNISYFVCTDNYTSNGALFWVIAELKKAFAKFWGA